MSSEMHMSHRIEIVKIFTDTGSLTHVKTLAVHEKPLNFDLLLGYDAVKALGGVLITQMGTVNYQKEASMYAALKIDKPDLSFKFDLPLKI